jgi:hypothetical protein
MRAHLAAVLLFAALGCQEKRVKSDVPAAPLAGIPDSALRSVAQKRIYFGHQSVGYNIAEGLEAIARERPALGLRIVESRSPDALRTAAFAHAANGRNHEPLTKIRDFADTLGRDGLGAQADVAFFKFCYVDFQADTDVERVFAEYRETLARLRQAFPSVRFVHVTSPLTVVPSGPKVWLKGLLGKKPWGAEANVVRERFNALVRREYAGKEPLFDLAAVESTRPDGTVEAFRMDGRSHPSLVPAYASDGKHLNDAGARWAAAHLLATLARLAE